MKKAWNNLQGKSKTQRIRGNSLTGNELTIEATHLYIRFEPQNEAEEEKIIDDRTLDTYTYPLDAELSDTITYYRDPEIPEGQPQYRYCAVPIDKVLPDAPYTLIDSLFLPEENITTLAQVNYLTLEAMADLGNRLAWEAERITGNLEPDDTVYIAPSQSKGSKNYTPSGRILVWDNVIGTTTQTTKVFDYWDYSACSGALKLISDDDALSPQVQKPCKKAVYRTETTTIDGSYVPVVDVEVRANRWFTTHKGITDANGNYTCDGTFKKQADYSIRWEKYHFSVRSGTFGQAILRKNNHTGVWNANLGRAASATVDDPQQYYALIFQAARDYYYGDRFGLENPPLNALLKKQIKIAAYLNSAGNTSGHAATYLHDGITAIGVPSALIVTGLITANLKLIISGVLTAVGAIVGPSIFLSEYHESAEIVYGVTAHELAHFAHWEMDKAAFRSLGWGAYVQPNPKNLADRAVIESWANGVEWAFAHERYERQFGIVGYVYDEANDFQTRLTVGDETNAAYTSLVVDLVDDDNQRVRLANPAFPQDRVDSYTLVQIQTALRGSRSWNAWRDNLFNQVPGNATRNNLNELFSNWHN